MPIWHLQTPLYLCKNIPYPFVDPLVIPATRYLRNSNATIAGGIIATRPAAAVIPYCMESFVINSAVTMDIGFV